MLLLCMIHRLLHRIINWKV